MNLEQARFNMVEQQIRTWDVFDPRVIDLLFAVKRELFVPEAFRRLAFADTAIPLGHGGSMLEPKFEAHAMQALAIGPELKNDGRVLEVGTGSGHMAALLAAHAGHVWSLEIEPGLAETARENLRRAGVENVTVVEGNGLEGHAAHAPYDVIMVSGAVPAIPQELLAQLKTGGKLFAFVGAEPAMQAQLVTRAGETEFATVTLFETVVPPLRGAAPAQRFVF